MTHVWDGYKFTHSSVRNIHKNRIYPMIQLVLQIAKPQHKFERKYFCHGSDNLFLFIISMVVGEQLWFSVCYNLKRTYC